MLIELKSLCVRGEKSTKRKKWHNKRGKGNFNVNDSYYRLEWTFHPRSMRCSFLIVFVRKFSYILNAPKTSFLSHNPSKTLTLAKGIPFSVYALCFSYIEVDTHTNRWNVPIASAHMYFNQSHNQWMLNATGVVIAACAFNSALKSTYIQNHNWFKIRIVYADSSFRVHNDHFLFAVWFIKCESSTAMNRGQYLDRDCIANKQTNKKYQKHFGALCVFDFAGFCSFVFFFL